MPKSDDFADSFFWGTLNEAARAQFGAKVNEAAREQIRRNRENRERRVTLHPGELPYYDAAGRVVGGILPPQR